MLGSLESRARRGRRRGPIAALLLALLAAAPAARAQPADARQQAGERFGRGVKLYEAGKYEAALLEFEAAHALVPHHQTLFNVAVTLKKLSRFGEALRVFERYLREGGEAISAEKRAAVQAELSEMRPFFAEAAVEIEGGPALLEVDGTAVGSGPFAEPILVETGTHLFRASRPGFEPAEQKLQVLSGNRYQVRLSPKPPAPTTAELKVTSLPSGASLRLDDQELGLSPWSGPLAAGGHRLVATLPDHETLELELMLTAGQSRAVGLELVPVTPWYRRWYVWTAGVAVLAGASFGVYYLQLPKADVVVSHP